MRRLIAIVALAVAVPVAAVLGLGASLGGGDGYEIRAIFDNASAVAPGGDVKIAGARVGVVESMDVAPGKKAALVLRIDDSRFTPFHANARCTIVLATFIGEKSVECQPGTARAARLQKIRSGAGKSQHLLPVTHTSSPVDLDIVNDTLRLPFRQRLTLVINELGTGLAGRGRELNAVIHRANPAFRETDKILATLARQNRVLADLAKNSDTVLAPLAREKQHVADFIQQGNATASAAAEETAATQASIQRLPGFLRQLRPLLSDLGGFADQASPVLRDLGAAAPATNRVTELLGPFSAAALPAVQSLGRTAAVGTPAVIAARPLTRSLRDFSTDAVPVSGNLKSLTQSLDRTGGLERFLDYVFYQTTSINGFDSLGHYLRTELIAKLACGIYATAPAAECNANFRSPPATTAASTDTLAKRIAANRSSRRRAAPSSPPASAGTGDSPSATAPQTAPRRPPSLSPRVERGSRQPLLDYLLGGDR
jgi:phospholipid/cholesterol/gamma-HCH transport system substrate-binding protein